MARPKKLSFPCKYCDKIFKRRTFLEKHLLSHSNTFDERRNPRIRSNWCHVCRQSFTQSGYELHVRTEHQYDSNGKYSDDSEIESDEDIGLKICNKKKYFVPNKSIKQEIDKSSSPKSPRKKALNLSKIQADPACSMVKIKTEPCEESSDTFKSKVSPKKGRKINTTSSFIICNKCGIKCKSPKGLSIHQSKAHKRNSSIDEHKISPEEVAIQSVLSKQAVPEELDQYKNSVMSSTNNQPLFLHNTLSSLSQNAQTGLIYNPLTLPIPPHNNTIGIGSQSNIQFVPVFLNQNDPVETVPKFDYESENYIKWIKKFIYRCKVHKYPLTAMLCQSVSHINEEITEALANPSGSLKKRSNHFYFLKIKSLLSEIMLGQLRYAMDVVTK